MVVYNPYKQQSQSYKPTDTEKELFGDVDGKKVKDKKSFYDAAWVIKATNYKNKYGLQDDVNSVKSMLQSYHKEKTASDSLLDKITVDDEKRKLNKKKESFKWLSSQSKAETKGEENLYKKYFKIGGTTENPTQADYDWQVAYNERLKSNEKKQSLLPNLSKKEQKTKSKGFLSGLFFNNNSTNQYDEMKRLANKSEENLKKSGKKLTDENRAKEFQKVENQQFTEETKDGFGRFGNRAINSASFGLTGELDKKNRGVVPYLSERKYGKGGGTDLLADLTGFAIPGAAEVKGANTALKGLEFLNGASKLAKVGKIAAEGATTMGLHSLGQIGAREAVNPNDYTLKDDAKLFGENVAAGALGDLVLRGTGKLLGEGIKKVLPAISKGAKELKIPTFNKGEVVAELPKTAENNPLYQSLSAEDRFKYVYDLLHPKKEINVESVVKPLSDNDLAQKAIDYKIDLENKHLPLDKNGDIDFNKIDFYQKKKDINPIETNTNSVYQMAEKLHPEDKAKLLGSMDSGKAGYTGYVEKTLNDLEENVVKKLGIKSGSKLSAAVQDFSERTYAKELFERKGIKLEDVPPNEFEEANLSVLKQKFPNDWQKVIEAEKWFRNYYDPVIDQMNDVRSQIYPGQPDKIIPKRSNYMPHRNDLEGFAQLKNIFDSPSNISPELEHASGFTKPNSKWQGFMQKRGLGEYKSDAIGNAVQYIQGAGHVLNIDPVIKVLRGIDNELTASTSTTANQNNLIRLIREHAGDLAGKTNETDRLLMNKAIGRKWLKAITFVNNRVKSNMILGNLSSTLGQIGNVPLGVAKAKQYAVPGLYDTVGQLKDVILKNTNSDAPIAKSTFLKERYLDKQIRKFDEGLLNKSKNLAAWMMETVDRAGTNFIWNSMYRKGLAEKIADPLKFADYETRKVVAGRGIGEVPLFQKSKTAQILMPFTLEVGNQWKVLKEMVGEKDAAGLLTFMVASWGLNKAVEEVRGNGGVAYDPLDAILDGYNETDGTTGEKALGSARYLTGETIGNIPGGNTALKIIGAEDKNQFGKGIFGSRNPNRFGSGITALKATENPLFALMPFGANQVTKTFKGAKSFVNEGEYTDKNELKFPVKQNVKNLPSFLFGPGATNEGKEFYSNNKRKLSKKQTEAYEDAKKEGEETKYYDSLLLKREQDSIIRKLKSLKKEGETKNKKEIEKLVKQLNNLRK